MLIVLLVIQILTLLAFVALLLRKPSASAETTDPLLAQLLAADLPAKIARLDVRFDGLDSHLRGQLAQLREDTANEANRSREAADAASAALRTEVLSNISTLGETLRTGLEGFRKDNTAAAESLRLAVDAQLAALTQRFSTFTAETNRHQTDSREALHKLLTELGAAQSEHQEKLRTSVENGLTKINQDNTAKLDQMRETVDEKLQKTLHSRLTESFGQVTEQLTRVHAGLGEMSSLAVGVGDLKKVLSGVKSRGILGEDYLGDQLAETCTSDQYIKNARIKAGTQETVEYALKIPNGPDSIVLLSLDSKFPNEDWERLQHAEENGTDEERKKTGAAFERAILAQGKKICEKYIDPPNTLPFAVMYLPTEALAAEVMRRPGLHAEMRTKYQVHVAGPANLAMMLGTFKLVFRTLKFEKNLNEVWKVFQIAQSEFEKFGGQMEKVVTQVGTVQNTLKEISGKTKTVNRALRNVSHLELGETAASTPATLSSSTFDGLLPQLAAAEEDPDE